MRITRIWMAPGALRVILDAHAKSVAGAPRAEPCGLLLGHRRDLGPEVVEAVLVRNAHPSAERAFLMEPQAMLEAGRAARARGLDLVGFWHGHTEGPAWPGFLDEDGMRSAQIEGTGPNAHVIVGRGTTGKRVVRGFREGRYKPKEVPIVSLKKARGPAGTTTASLMA
jgi:proteasome lid subunit RPN8/RPN11